MLHLNTRFILTSAFLILFALSITGCGGSQPTIEDEAVTDTGVEEQVEGDTTATTEQPQDEQVQQEQPQEQPAQQNQQPKTEETQEYTSDELQQEIDTLKSENVQLQEKLSTTEKTNKQLATKISDLEAALAAAKAAKKETKPVVESRPTAPGKTSAEDVRAYTSAVNLVKQRKYSDALSELQTLLNTSVKDDYADNCYYWMGECEFQMKNYRQAISHFEQVKNYKFSEKKDDAQLMIAQCYERLGDKEKATEEYKRLVTMYPTSEYVARAKSKIK
jgi:TolA-binding protein